MKSSGLIVLVGLVAVLASALPQDPHGVPGLTQLNAFVSTASLQNGGLIPTSEPLVASASETRFRFGSSNHDSGNSERRLFIPGLDRRDRRPTGLLSGASSVIGAPPKTTKTPITTPSSKPKPIITSHDNKFSDDYYYLDDEYYYDYYYDYYDGNITGERQLGPLGVLDPPSVPPTHPTTRPTQASSTSRPFRFDFNNKLRERPSLISSRTTPFPPRSSSKTQSTRPSLADLLLKRVQNAEESQPSTPVNNDLTGQNREPKVIEETHTEKEEMQVHVTTNTESSRIVSSIKASHSITLSEDPSLITPTQSFVYESTTAPPSSSSEVTEPSSTSEVTELSKTALPETTSKRSLADIFETVDSQSFLTGNVNSAVLATENEAEALQTTTTTVATPEIESIFDSSSIFESLLNKNVGAKTESTPTTTQTIKLGSLLDAVKTVDISAFLPPGYKADTAKEPSSTTTASTTTAAATTQKDDETIFDLFPALKSPDVSSFVPPGYKPAEEQPQESTTKKAKIDLLDDVSSLLPPGYKAHEEEKTKPLIKTVDVSAFLPPGYKPPANAKVPVVETLDVSAFLPPDYKPQGPDVEASTKKVEIDIVDMSSFLPPGYKPPGYENYDSEPDKPQGPPVIKTADVSAFLPPGYKEQEDEESAAVKPVIKTVDISAFLPPGFKATEGEDNVSSSTATTSEATTTTRKGPKGLKFPKRPDRPSFLITTTTQRPTPSGPPTLKPTIRNIFANRAPTKPFTGWPSTTPTPPKFSAIPVNIDDFLAKHLSKSITTTTTTSTTTTTTTTTTQRPTTPGTCGRKCRLFATIKITNGTQWRPELANRDTIEWQQLANSIEIELDQIYLNSPLAPWYEGVEIDGFHKGSVLVDYFVQLNDINDKVGTSDLKEVLNRATASGEGHTLGNFTLDSRATDFIVMKVNEARPAEEDTGYLIPQWLIAVIVIGLASLLFILIFGITVLVNRSRVNKRHNIPLTEEMLNELNKSHMGGFTHGHHTMNGGIDNYAMDAGLYDMDAVWNDKRMDRRMMKPPSSQGKGYNPNYNINIYDSWRTDWSGPYGSSATYAKRPRTDTNF